MYFIPKKSFSFPTKAGRRRVTRACVVDCLCNVTLLVKLVLCSLGGRSSLVKSQISRRKKYIIWYKISRWKILEVFLRIFLTLCHIFTHVSVGDRFYKEWRYMYVVPFTRMIPTSICFYTLQLHGVVRYMCFCFIFITEWVST